MDLLAVQLADAGASDEWLLISFLAEIANYNTRLAYHRGCSEFLGWLEVKGLRAGDALPLHVAAWREIILRQKSVATVKLYLAAVRGFYDWLTLNHYVAHSPASSVKSPRETVAVGKTTYLEPAEVRTLLHSIDPAPVIGLRDRALIGLMLYTFARVGAALSLNCGDLRTRSGSTWITLREKRGKLHEMPLHPQAEQWLLAYLSVADNSVTEQPLFRTIHGRSGLLTERRLHSANAYAMVRRRAKAAGITTEVCNHTFRATGITAYLVGGGSLEMAAKLANHASTRTTQLYDRRVCNLMVAEIQRVSF